ncbi:MAG: hypothetical protein IPN46_11585 [Saprospiraceae bacterium]|nr:hypothetical protein [Saprospiraceae bacterium]
MEYRDLFHEGKISESIILKAIGEKKGNELPEVWFDKMLNGAYKDTFAGRRSHLRNNWKDLYSVDLGLGYSTFYLDSYVVISIKGSQSGAFQVEQRLSYYHQRDGAKYIY